MRSGGISRSNSDSLPGSAGTSPRIASAGARRDTLRAGGIPAMIPATAPKSSAMITVGRWNSATRSGMPKTVVYSAVITRAITEPSTTPITAPTTPAPSPYIR